MLKCNYFGKKRLSELDEFIYDYHSSVLLQENQFGDYYLNGQHKTKNNRTNTRSECNVHHRKSVKIGQKSRLVEATFKKRKRKTTSYYSSPPCAKKLKYNSSSKTTKEIFVNNFSNTHCSTNFIFFPGCEQHPIIKDVACFIWHELPFNKRSICDVAVTMKDGRNATFLVRSAPTHDGKRILL